MQRNANRSRTVESSDVWSLQKFIDAFEPHVSPELLAHIYVEILFELEIIHRQNSAHGALGPDTIMIHRDGTVELSEERAEGTPQGDLYTLALMFQSIMLHYGRSTFRWRAGRAKWRRNRSASTGLQDAARIHPMLKLILKKASAQKARRRYANAWQLRAALLDFLAELGVEHERYFLRQFIRRPLNYNQELSRELSERECRRIEESSKWGMRRATSHELQYLLEVSPGNPKALSLLRMVREGRRRALAQFAYASAVVALLLVGGSVILTKLHLLPPSVPKQEGAPLVIEAAPSPAASISRGISSKDGYIDVTEEERVSPTLALIKPDMGQVHLELDDDAVAYFDAAPNVARPYKNGDRIWLSEGSHSVTIVKPGYPQAIAQLSIKSGHLTTLAARATAN